MTSEGALNRPDNGFRDVPYSESEADHLFYTFRHFPELAISKPESDKLQKQLSDGSCDWRTRKSVNRAVQLRSTHKLKELSTSALDDSFRSLRDFRKTLYNEKSQNSLALTQTSAFVLKPARTREPDIDPLTSANNKLGKLAVKFDSQGVNNDLKGFAGIDLSKKEFDTQLKRCLCIWLTQEELDALMVAMDTDGNGAIDGVEFVRYFFDLGMKERDRIREDRIAIQMRKEAEAKKLKQREDEKLRAKDRVLQVPFTLQDYDNAIEKIGENLLKFPALSSDAVQFRAFFGRMGPHTFKTQLESIFTVRFKNSEIASLIQRYGQELDGHLYVEGTNIVRELISIQQSFARRREGKFKTYGENKMKELKFGNSLENFPRSLGR